MPGKAFCANAAVLLDVSRKIPGLGLNGLGLRLAGVGFLAPFGKGGSIVGSFGMPMVEHHLWGDLNPTVVEHQKKSSHDSCSLKSRG